METSQKLGSQTVDEPAAQDSRVIPWLLGLILALWIVNVCYQTWPAVTKQIAFFGDSSPAYARALAIAAPLLALGAVAYAFWRRRGFWRHEPIAMALLVIAPSLYRHPVGSVVAGFALLSAWSLGSWLLERAGLIAPTALSEIGFAVAAGLAVQLVFAFFMGLADLYTPVCAAALILVPILVRGRRLAHLREAAGRTLSDWRAAPSLGRSILIGCALFFIFLLAGLTVATALTPSIAVDALLFHLPLIKTHALAGGLIDFSQLAYSYRPQGYETLLAVCYLLGGQASAQLFSLAFLGLALLFVIELCRLSRFPPPAIVLGVAATAGMPFLLWSGAVVKNDVAMASFQAASLLACVLWLETREIRWIGFASFLLGASFAVKPTAVFAALPLGLFFLYACFKHARPFRALAATAASGAVTASLWYVHTWLLKGSLTYPDRASHALDALDPSDPNTAINNLWRYVNIPIQAHTKGYMLFEGPIQTPVGIIAAFFFVTLVIAPRLEWSKAAKLTILLVAGGLFYWSSTMRTLRYGISPVLMVGPLLAYPFWEFFRRTPAAVRGFVTAAVIYGCLVSFSASLIMGNSSTQIRYLARRLDDQAYLAESHANYPAYRALSDVATRDDDILSVGSCTRGFVPYPWKFWCASPGKDEDPKTALRALLAERNYRFLLLSRRYDEPAGAVLTAPKLLYRDQRQSLFELPEPSSSGP